MTTSAARPQAAAGPAPPEWLQTVLSDTSPDGELAVFDQPSPVSAARVFVATVLTQWQADDSVYDAQLVVTELITNAMRHGGGAASLALVLRGQHVGCAVSDHSTAPPIPTTPDYFAEYGRGMHLIQALSICWGWYPMTHGKRVWAVLR